MGTGSITEYVYYGSKNNSTNRTTRNREQQENGETTIVDKTTPFMVLHVLDYLALMIRVLSSTRTSLFCMPPKPEHGHRMSLHAPIFAAHAQKAEGEVPTLKMRVRYEDKGSKVGLSTSVKKITISNIGRSRLLKTQEKWSNIASKAVTKNEHVFEIKFLDAQEIECCAQLIKDTKKLKRFLETYMIDGNYMSNNIKSTNSFDRHYLTILYNI